MSANLPIHPFTGLRAIGFTSRGPVWPVMGGDGTGEPPKPKPNADPNGDPPPDDPPKPNADSDDDPPPDESKWDTFVDEFKNRGVTPDQLAARLEASRKWEARAKTNAEKAKRLDELEEASKTEAQKLADAKAAAEKEAADAKAQTALMKAAVKHGLTEEDLELLGTGTPEEIEARAERLAKRLKAGKKAADFGGGSRGSDVGGSGKQWTKADLVGKTTDEINAARKAGHLDRLMGKTH